MTELSHLTALLHDAVPEPPTLIGLAAGAERLARRARRRRRSGLVAAAAAVVLVAAIALPLLHAGHRQTPVVSEVGESCRATSEGSTSMHGLAYVRFCPVNTDVDRAFVPDIALTRDFDGVTSIFAGTRLCNQEPLAGAFRIVAGYRDGTVTTLSSCDDDYAVLMHAIARQQSAQLTTPPPTPPTPSGPTTPVCPAADAATASTLTGSALLSLPVAYAVVCTRRPLASEPPQVRALTQDQGEEVRLRVLAQGGATVGRCGDAASRDARVDYVLVLADGSTHDVVTDLDACELTIDGVRAGVPSVALYDRVPSGHG